MQFGDSCQTKINQKKLLVRIASVLPSFRYLLLKRTSLLVSPNELPTKYVISKDLHSIRAVLFVVSQRRGLVSSIRPFATVICVSKPYFLAYFKRPVLWIYSILGLLSSWYLDLFPTDHFLKAAFFLSSGDPASHLSFPRPCSSLVYDRRNGDISILSRCTA